MRSRPLLRWLVIATAGMLLFCVGVYIGLGFAVRSRWPWAVKVLGVERCAALRMSYLRAMGGLLPRDSDGDYFPDSAERYVWTNPSKANDHLRTRFVASDWEVMVDDRGDLGAYSIRTPQYVLQPGERRRLRTCLVSDRDRERLRFSPGMQLRLSSSHSGTVDLPALVAVATDGSLEFDLLISKATAGISVDARQPATGEWYGGFAIDAAWRQLPIPCTVERQPVEHRIAAQFVTDMEKLRLRSVGVKGGMEGLGIFVVRLTWPRVEGADLLYIEAMPDGPAGDGDGDEWFPVAVRTPVSSICRLAYWHHTRFRGNSAGGLKFRVVPAKFTGPER